jgi:diguanylate cyclase (GGDEF)-like protein/PAS domain S-box-containing protein
MTLRAKTFYVIGLTLLALIAVLYLSSLSLTRRNLIHLEEASARENVGRVQDALKELQNRVDSQVLLASAWDDAVQFVQKPSKAFRDLNLSDSSLALLNSELIIYTRLDGSIVFGAGYDLAASKIQPMPEEVRPYIAPGRNLLSHTKPQSVRAELAVLPKGIMLLVSRPVIRSTNQGSLYGTLILGRYLSSAELDRLGKVTRFKIVMYQLAFATSGSQKEAVPILPPDFQNAQKQLIRNALARKSDNVFVRPLNNDFVAGYTYLGDIAKRPIAILRVDARRDIYKQGELGLRSLVSALVVVGLAFIATTLVLLERMVLSPVERLSKGVSAISESGDLSQRVAVRGNDELAHLGTDINSMLTTLDQSQKQLSESEERLTRVLETNADGILIVDLTGRVTFANAAAERVLGTSREELMQRPYVDESWHPTSATGEEGTEGDSLVTRVVRSGAAVYGSQYTIQHSQRGRVILSANAAPLRDVNSAGGGANAESANTGSANSSSNITGVVLSLTDITAHKTLEDRLAHLAFHDALTGLPNRSLFVDRLQQNLARAMRHKHLTVVLFIDLDNFKMINDSLGHMAGDALLSGVAHRLQDCIRAEDTAARLGGDEFAILLDNISDAGQAVVVVEHILNSFEAPILVEGRELFITPSIGIAVSSSEDDATQVLRNADAAMYEAKRKGKGRYQLFHTDIAEETLYH